MKKNVQIKLTPFSPKECILYASILIFSLLIGIILFMIYGNRLEGEKIFGLYIILLGAMIAIIVQVFCCYGYGSDDEKFIFLTKGKKSPLMRTKIIYFNNINYLAIVKNMKNKPVKMEIHTKNKIYSLGQKRVINRIIRDINIKKLDIKSVEIKQRISAFQRLKFWWMDGKIEIKEVNHEI